jgi:hypothetical protein
LVDVAALCDEKLDLEDDTILVMAVTASLMASKELRQLLKEEG